MKIVGWQLIRLVAEANQDLVGGVVESLRLNRDSGRMLMIVGSRRGKRYLVIGTRGEGTAFFWTHHKLNVAGFETYIHTERFNRLKGARLSSVSLPCSDRWIKLDFEKRDTKEHRSLIRSLIVTWAHSAGNVLLLDSDETILESWWTEPSLQAARRFVAPESPPIINWQSLTFPDFRRLRLDHPEMSVDEFVRTKLWGIDQTLSDTIAATSRRFDPETPAATSVEELWQEFQSVMSVLRTATDPSTPVGGVPPQPIVNSDHSAHQPVDRELAGSSLSAALAGMDKLTTAKSTIDSLTKRLRTELKSRVRKISRRITAAERAIEYGQNSERLKRGADLLGAQRHLLQRGEDRVRVTDWETGEEIEIKLNKAWSAQENIEAAYRRARDAATAAERAQSELPELTRQIDQWNALIRELDGHQVSDDRLAQIENALGMTSQESKSKKPGKRLPYREFIVGSDQIWVGRSRRDNDELTLKLARPDDVFFHAQGSPGSHVILRRADRRGSPSQETIVQAAQIAAFFSRAKHAGVVPVSYTEVRYVRKPRKAPPGEVHLVREETVMVKPLPPPGYHGA